MKPTYASGTLLTHNFSLSILLYAFFKSIKTQIKIHVNTKFWHNTFDRNTKISNVDKTYKHQ